MRDWKGWAPADPSAGAPVVPRAAARERLLDEGPNATLGAQAGSGVEGEPDYPQLRPASPTAEANASTMWVPPSSMMFEPVMLDESSPAR